MCRRYGRQWKFSFLIILWKKKCAKIARLHQNKKFRAIKNLEHRNKLDYAEKGVDNASRKLDTRKRKKRKRNWKMLFFNLSHKKRPEGNFCLSSCFLFICRPAIFWSQSSWMHEWLVCCRRWMWLVCVYTYFPQSVLGTSVLSSSLGFSLVGIVVFMCWRPCSLAL